MMLLIWHLTLVVQFLDTVWIEAGEAPHCIFPKILINLHLKNVDVLTEPVNNDPVIESFTVHFPSYS
ncbi:MAG: hypothetical protein CM15mP107_4930 [Bacteroidota bacterium]|nr:MAG: hypothetical protein CM15mP107_4930 [Bacteroidota bacterium]